MSIEKTDPEGSVGSLSAVGRYHLSVKEGLQQSCLGFKPGAFRLLGVAIAVKHSSKAHDWQSRELQQSLNNALHGKPVLGSQNHRNGEERANGGWN